MFRVSLIEKAQGERMTIYLASKSDRALKNSTAVYLLKGSLTLVFPDGSERKVSASKRRVNGGTEVPGTYVVEFDEDSVYKCLTPLKSDLLDDVEIIEHTLKKGEIATHGRSGEVFAMIGSLRVEGQTIQENSGHLVSEPVFTVEAIEDVVYCLTRKRGDKQSKAIED